MLADEQVGKLRRSLVFHEGYRNFPYMDTLGNLTIGIGYNLSNRGLPDEWVNDQYFRDVSYFYSQLHNFSWFHMLNTDRQIVLIDMAFMGWKKFLEFKELIHSLEVFDYDKAADEMLNSEWAKQVKGRATTLANAMKTGVYEI